MSFKLPAGRMLQKWDEASQSWIDRECLKGDETIEPTGVYRGNTCLVFNDREPMHAQVDGIMMKDWRADGSGLVINKPHESEGKFLTRDPFLEDTAALAIEMARLNPDKQISIGQLIVVPVKGDDTVETVADKWKREVDKLPTHLGKIYSKDVNAGQKSR